MAIVQISRITQRKGLIEDLPQPLASAELGWATDQRRLFIGNGTLDEGAPVVGNTEILTEFSDILSFATEYTYKGENAGYTVQTGPTSGAPVSQSLQRRLDSYAVISDFGATGDGVTDVHSNINRALNQIYCRQLNPQIRRSIFFPAGLYIITDTLDIPPYATLYGEGSENTIIYFYVQPHTSNIAYSAGVLVSSGGLYYRSLADVPIGTLVTNGTYWAGETLPEYIVQTADSLQQTGSNIATNGAVAPGNLSITGIKFMTNVIQNGVLIEKAPNCVFKDVAVEGPLVQANLTTATNDIAAIRWISSPSLVCKNVTWDNCSFSKFDYATSTDQQIEGVTISNSSFDTLHQGVVLGDVSPVDGGPTGFRILHNTFDNIYNEGVVFTNVSLNATGHNVFYNVGNHFQNYSSPATAIIDIDANNNISVGDMFVRNDTQSATYPRIKLNSTNSMAMSMNTRAVSFYQDNVQVTGLSNTLDLGTYSRTAGIEDTILNNSGANLVVVTNTGSNGIKAFKVDYTIIRDTSYRSGTLTVASGTGFVYTDDYVENSSTGVTLTAANGTGVVTISYTASNTGVNGSIKYSITNLG